MYVSGFIRNERMVSDSTSSRCTTRVQCCPCHPTHVPCTPHSTHTLPCTFPPMHHLVLPSHCYHPLQLSLHTAIHHLPPRFPSAASFRHHISLHPSLTSSHQSRRPASHVVPPVTSSRQSRRPTSHVVPPVTASLQSRHIPPVTAYPSSHGTSLQSRHIPPVMASLQSGLLSSAFPSSFLCGPLGQENPATPQPFSLTPCPEAGWRILHVKCEVVLFIKKEKKRKEKKRKEKKRKEKKRKEKKRKEFAD
jgi:hypothetical protein